LPYFKLAQWQNYEIIVKGKEG